MPVYTFKQYRYTFKQYRYTLYLPVQSNKYVLLFFKFNPYVIACTYILCNMYFFFLN